MKQLSVIKPRSKTEAPKPENPKPSPASPSSSTPDPPMPPVNKKPISEIQSLVNLKISETALSTLSTYFSGYRDIESTLDSFGLSFLISLFDKSIHFNQTESVYIIQRLYSYYQHEMGLQDINNQRQIVDQILAIIQEEKLLSEKLEEFQRLIDSYYLDFVNMYRNCMNVIGKLTYNDKKNMMIKWEVEFEDLKKNSSNNSTPFPQVYFMYFCEYFKIRICIVNSVDYSVEQNGSRHFNPIYMLNTNNKFRPLSTSFENSLRSINSPQEFQGMIGFITESERLKNSNKKITELEENIKKENEKFNRSLEVFKNLATNNGSYSCNVSNCLNGYIDEPPKELLANITCDICGCLTYTYGLECRHRVCGVCYSTCQLTNPMICRKCGVFCYFNEFS